MTPEDYRKWLQDTQPTGQSSLPPQVMAQDVTDGESAGPSTDTSKMVDPTAQQQATLADKYGTGFINYGRYGKDSPATQPFQSIPASSGSLYDPLAPVPPPPPPTSGTPPAAPPPTDYDTPGYPGEGPVGKPPFQRTRRALAYRGSEY